MSQAPTSAVETSRRKVLVVDDNADIAHTFAALLEARGHSAKYATDSREALTAKTNRFIKGNG